MADRCAAKLGRSSALSSTGGWVVRPATIADLPAVVALTKRYYETTHYAGMCAFCSESAESLGQLVLSEGVMFVIDAAGPVVGVAGMLLHPFMFNRDVLCASEVVWWIDPAAEATFGVRELLRATEDACRETGARWIHMYRLADSAPSVDKFYTRLGYAPSVNCYAKEL